MVIQSALANATLGTEVYKRWDLDAVADRMGIPLRETPLEIVTLDTANPGKPTTEPDDENDKSLAKLAASAGFLGHLFDGPVLAASDDAGDGHWVTLDGEHVFIKGGVITKGPAHLVGKKPGELTETDGGLTEEQAEKHYENGEIPDGYYIHGRANRADLDTGHAVQATQRTDVAEQYAGKNGSVHYLKPKAGAKVLDMTDAGEREKLAGKLWKDYEQGNAPPDFDKFVSREGEGGAKSMLEKELNPSNIVDSAGFFDNSAYNSWISEKTGASWIKTQDGAIVLDVSPQKTESVVAWRGGKSSKKRAA
jgi:hypothetical protein